MSLCAARVAPEKTVFRPVLLRAPFAGDFPENLMSEFWQKYKDPRWQKLRLEKMQSAGFACEHCSATEITLHVHHKIYRRNHSPWEYELLELECLCEDCHEAHHELKDALKEAITSLDQHAFHELVGYAEALALKQSCEGVIRAISPMHADGISAAFSDHDYDQVLALADQAFEIDLELLWELHARRKKGRTDGAH